MRKSVFALCFLAFSALSLTGCLSHWFIDTSTRLQVENATEEFTLYGLDVLAEDSVTYEKWIDETILPGERSHVSSADWIGKFRIRLRYGKDGADTLSDVRNLEIDGGSMFLKVSYESDSLVYTFK